MVLKLKDVLIFFSGAAQIPPLGFPRPPSLTFLHDSMLPTSSTCSLELQIPTVHTDYESFEAAMVMGLKGHDGFGVI